MLGEKEETWGPPLGFEDESNEEPAMYGMDKSTWGPGIRPEEEKPHMLGEKAATYGPPLGSDEPRVPILPEDEVPMLGENESSWGPPLESEEKPSPFFFSANSNFHGTNSSNKPVVQASAAAKPQSKSLRGGFASFFDKVAEEIKKVEKPAKKLVHTVEESVKDGKISTAELEKIEDEVDELAEEVNKDRKEIRSAEKAQKKRFNKKMHKSFDKLAHEIENERK